MKNANVKHAQLRWLSTNLLKVKMSPVFAPLERFILYIYCGTLILRSGQSAVGTVCLRKGRDFKRSQGAAVSRTLGGEIPQIMESSFRTTDLFPFVILFILNV